MSNSSDSPVTSLGAAPAVSSTSTWSDALDRAGINGVVSGLRHVAGRLPIAGRAVTAKQSAAAFGVHPREAFDVPAIVEAVGPGTVLVIDVGGAAISTLGSLAATAVSLRGAVAAIVDGGCRDLDELHATGLTVCSRHITPISGKKRIRTVEVNGAVTCGGVTVHAGDYVVADSTGIVVVPAARFEEVLAIAREIDRKDRAFADALQAGGTFADIARSLGHL